VKNSKDALRWMGFYFMEDACPAGIYCRWRAFAETLP